MTLLMLKSVLRLKSFNTLTLSHRIWELNNVFGDLLLIGYLFPITISAVPVFQGNVHIPRDQILTVFTTGEQ